jgi:hypothetical protein
MLNVSFLLNFSSVPLLCRENSRIFCDIENNIEKEIDHFSCSGKVEIVSKRYLQSV